MEYEKAKAIAHKIVWEDGNRGMDLPSIEDEIVNILTDESNQPDCRVVQKIAEVIDNEIADYQREIKIYNDRLGIEDNLGPLRRRKSIIAVLKNLKLKIASNFTARNKK